MRSLVFLTIFAILVSFFPQVFGQISLGIPAEQDLTIYIDDENNVHVVHEVSKNNKPQKVELVSGTISNLEIINEDGDEPQHAKSGTGELQEITIFPTNQKVLIKYDLSDVLTLKDGVWTWKDFFYPGTLRFMFPDTVDVVYVKERPVYIDEFGAEGIRCHGCSTTLEYILDEPKILQEVIWEDKVFTVEINTLADISSFSFDQQTKTISFNVSEENQFIDLIIPLELLWNPYEVYVGDEDFLEKMQTLNHELIIDEGFVHLNMRPDTAGTVRIIGTTVIPEFPFFMPLLLVGIVMVIAIQSKKILSPH